MASHFTMRFGQALRDVEQAIELNTKSELTEQFDEALQSVVSSRKKSIKLRGPGFMVDQLIEQEKLFQQGLLLMERRRKEEVGQAFQASMPWEIAYRSPGEIWVSA